MNMFDPVIDRTGSNSSRWQQFGADVLAMTTGDTDFAMPPAIAEAIKERSAHGVLGYDDPPQALTDAIIERLRRLYGWEVHPEWMSYLPGVVPGLNQAVQAFSAPGQAVLSEVPVYYPFLDAPGNSGRRLVTIPAIKGESRWLFDFEATAAQAAQPDAHVYLLCNPQNPTGRVATQGELEQLADICASNDVVICSDEIHCEVIFDKARHIPLASLNDEVAANTVTLMSPSKAFGMSGLGGAFAITSNTGLREQFDAAGRGMLAGINAYAVVAMLAAYRDCDQWLAEFMDYLEDNRRLALSRLQDMGLEVAGHESTYFLWLDFAPLRLNDPFEALLNAGVALSQGERFGGGGYLRLNFATPRARLSEVLDRMETGLLSR